MASEMTINRKSKDSLFVKLFQDRKYILQLYKEIHPESTDITVDDIQVQTLESIIINTICNDLGFLVKDRLVMLFEAQSTWNPNMTVRLLFYIAETFRRYITSSQQSEHSSAKLQLPKPELYVIYSGDGEKPSVISLNDEFFGGASDIDVKVHVLSKVDTSLSGQYIGFCKVFDEQRKIHKNNIDGAKETYRICIEKGYLVDYMKEHEKEVIDMMSELFDEEVLRKQYDIAEKKLRSIEIAKNLLIDGSVSQKVIAAATGLSTDEIELLSAQLTPANA